MRIEANDGRVVRLDFVESDKDVTIYQTFDADSTQPEDRQREEWQLVLNRFARYVERQCTKGIVEKPQKVTNLGTVKP